jgi:hypothetical protein
VADPISIAAAVGIAGTAVGGIVGGFGAGESGQAQANAYRYKAGVALLNKQVNEQNAAWAIQSGGAQAEVAGLKAGQQIGSTKVIQSGSGLDVNSGSNEAVRESQTSAAQYDQSVIQWDADKTGYGYQIKAVSDVAETQLDQMASEQAKTAGDIGEITSFINAGSSVASKWAQGKQSGMFG